MKNIIVANWKMHGTREDWVSWATSSKEISKKCENVDVVLCAPSAAFSTVEEVVEGEYSIHLGGQSVHEREQGAFTGETSVSMLKEFGAKYSLIGHSEYRKMFNIKEGQLKGQIEQCLATGITPILCIGESAEEREQGKTNAVLKAQLEESLKDVHFLAEQKIVIAYEPVWGISSVASKTPEVADIEGVFSFINSELSASFEGVCKSIQLCYGGSVDAGNVERFMAELGIHGVLVGSASLKSDVFQDIVRKVNQI